MAAGSEKRTPRWNQDVKEAIQKKKMLAMPRCQTSHYLICNPGILSREKQQFLQ